MNNYKKILLTTFVILITFLVLKFLPHSKIKEMIEEAGIYAPIIYILLFIVLPIFFFPVPVLALSGGISFGLVLGTIYTMIGASLNCMIMFLISRYTMRDFVDNMIKKYAKSKTFFEIQKNTSENQFLIIIILRLIPLVPYNIINYGCGLTKISFKDYMLASILGIFPGTIVFLNIGDKSANIYSNEFIFSIILMIVLIAFSYFISKKYRYLRNN